MQPKGSEQSKQPRRDGAQITQVQTKTKGGDSYRQAVGLKHTIDSFKLSFQGLAGVRRTKSLNRTLCAG